VEEMPSAEMTLCTNFFVSGARPSRPSRALKGAAPQVSLVLLPTLSLCELVRACVTTQGLLSEVKAYGRPDFIPGWVCQP